MAHKASGIVETHAAEHGAKPHLSGARADDAAAVTVALQAVRRTPELSRTAADYLAKQSRLADLQIEHFELEHELQVGAARRQRFSERIRNAFLLLSFSAAMALAAALGLTAWDARNAHGLVVEPLKAPGDLAAQGVSGAVAGGILIDRMRSLAASADDISFRKADSIAHEWGEELSVEIPETGLSISEAQRQLRRWLGQETRVSGEIYHTPGGLAARLRTGEGEAIELRRDGSDAEALLNEAAERLFAQTQPYRYALILVRQSRMAEAERLLRATTRSPDRRERAWAYEALGQVLLQQGQVREALRMRDRALQLNPELVIAYAVPEWLVGHSQQALVDMRTARATVRRGKAADLSPAGLAWFKLLVESTLADVGGDYLSAARVQDAFYDTPFQAAYAGYGAVDAAHYYALNHDTQTASRLLASSPLDDAAILAGYAVNGLIAPHFYIAVDREDWPAAVADFMAVDATLATSGKAEEVRRTFVWPWLAYALARSGRNADAEALIARTPLDCDGCVRLRGDVAAARGDWQAAERWYALAAEKAPDVPLMDIRWGAMLLAKGDLDNAIRRFASAHRKGPRNADALELWGEALIRKGDTKAAAAKLAQAKPLAPRWGRLEMEWGEALAKLGKVSEAQAHWRQAATMDLTPAERLQLAAMVPKAST